MISKYKLSKKWKEPIINKFFKYPLSAGLIICIAKFLLGSYDAKALESQSSSSILHLQPVDSIACCKYKLYRNSSEVYLHRGQCIGDLHAKINTVGFSYKKYLKVSKKGATKRFPLHTLWGYKKEDQHYRVFKNRVYHIIEHNKLVIYQGTGYNQRRYYFSKGLDGDVYWFSKKKLIKAFAGDKEFTALLNNGLSVHQLLYYDECNKQYYINRLMIQLDHVQDPSMHSK